MKKEEKNKSTTFSLSKKMILLMILFSTLMTISFGFLSYSKTKDLIMKSYGERASYNANLISYTLDVEKIKYYKKSVETDEEYEKIVKKLDYIRNKLNLTYLYVIAPISNNNNEGIYIYDTSLIEDSVYDSIEERQLLGDVTEQISKSDIAQKIIRNEKVDNEIEISYDEVWGHLATAYSPIVDSNNNVVALVCVDISMSIIFQEIYNNVFKTMIIIISIIMFCLLLILYIVEKFIVRPINTIKKSVDKFIDKKNKDSSKQIISIKNQDEIGNLAISFNKMMYDIENYVKNIKKINIEKEQVSAELSVANKIQISMLPCIFPAFPEHKEFDIYAIMNPAKTVGGDFYDFFLIGDDYLGFVISDVSGKGISAALFMVIAKILINNEAHNRRDPSEILSKANKQLCMNNDIGMFATAFLGILSLKTGELIFSNAGHTIPLIKKCGSTFEYINVKKHFVLGGMPDAKYSNEKIYLEKDDMLFLYTDGVTEANNKEKELFSAKRLKSTLNELDTKHMKLKDIVEKIRIEIKEFAQEESQSDDITMLILKFKEQIP